MNSFPEWDEHKYKTLRSVILGHVSENISVSGEICSERKRGEERGEGREEKGRDPKVGSHPHVRNPEKYLDSRNTSEKIHKLATRAAKNLPKFLGGKPKSTPHARGISRSVQPFPQLRLRPWASAHRGKWGSADPLENG